MMKTVQEVRGLVEQVRRMKGEGYAPTPDEAEDAARARRLWSVDTSSAGEDSIVIAASAEEALGIVAEGLDAEMAVPEGWTADRIELLAVEQHDTCDDHCACHAPRALRYAVITIEQHDAARALARSFGHRWASERDAPSALAYTDRVRYQGEGIDTAEIARAAVADAPENTIGGIYSPEVGSAHVLGYRGLGDVPVVVHATGTRRLRWHILPDGETRLYISRPNGDASIVVLSAAVDAARRVTITVGAHTEIRPHARHWMALLEALVPLVGYECAWESVLPNVANDVRLSLAPCNGSTVWVLVDADAPKCEPQPGDVLPTPALAFPVGIRSLTEAFGMLRCA